MDGNHDLELILRSRTPIVVIESQDEARILEMLQAITMRRASTNYIPLFRWTITDGLQRLDISLEPQSINSQPTDVLKHIRAVSKPGLYVLLDFHPFLEDPVHVRLIKDICINFRKVERQIVLISHKVKMPVELEGFCARFDIALPNEDLSLLAPEFHDNVTPVLVTLAVDWVDETRNRALRTELENRVAEWADSKQEGDLHAYLSLYSEEFQRWGMDKSEWSSLSLQTGSLRAIRRAGVSDLLLLGYPEEDGVYLSRFQMEVVEDERTTVNRTRLYWRRDANGVLKIVAEDEG